LSTVNSPAQVSSSSSVAIGQFEQKNNCKVQQHQRPQCTGVGYRHSKSAYSHYINMISRILRRSSTRVWSASSSTQNPLLQNVRHFAVLSRVSTPFTPPKFTRGHFLDEKGMREVTFVLRDGTRRTVQGKDGENLLEVAHENGIEMEGACEASCACSTCHCIVDSATFALLPEASEAEEDLLDLAPGLEETSRLGCQIILNEDSENGVYHLPKNTLNFYVDGHVPEAH